MNMRVVVTKVIWFSVGYGVRPWPTMVPKCINTKLILCMHFYSAQRTSIAQIIIILSCNKFQMLVQKLENPRFESVITSLIHYHLACLCYRIFK